MGKKTKWIKLIERDTEVLMIYQYIDGQKFYPEVIGIDFEPKRMKYQEEWILLWEEDTLREYHAINKKYKQDPKFLLNLVKKTAVLGEKLLRIASKTSLNLKNKSNKNLTDSFWQFHLSLEKFMPFVSITYVAAKLLSKEINDFLKKNFSDLAEDQRSKYFTILTTPQKETNSAKEFKALLQVADIYKKMGRFTPQIEKQIKGIYKKYSWLGAVRVGWTYLRDDYNLKHYRNMIKKLAKENPEEKLHEIDSQILKQKKDYKKVANMKEAKPELIKKTNLLQEYLYQKNLRGEYIVHALLLVKPLLKEIAQRLDVTLENLVYFTPEEIVDSLKGKNLPDFQARKRGYDIFMEGGQVTLKVRKPKVKKIIKERRVLKGATAQLGKARGRVKIIFDPQQVTKMKKGDILVTKMTSPDFMMAIHRAAAIITDEGGITCHAAIVSREFGIPCIVGTKIATQALKDDDFIEIDATGKIGIARKIRKK